MAKFNPYYKPYKMDPFVTPVSQTRKLKHREVVSPAWGHRLVKGQFTPEPRLLATLLYCISDDPLKPWKP